MYVNPHYMRSNPLMGPTEREEQAVSDHSDVSGDVPWQQRVRGTPQGTLVESQYTIHGRGRGPLHQTVG